MQKRTLYETTEDRCAARVHCATPKVLNTAKAQQLDSNNRYLSHFDALKPEGDEMLWCPYESKRDQHHFQSKTRLNGHSG